MSACDLFIIGITTRRRSVAATTGGTASGGGGGLVQPPKTRTVASFACDGSTSPTMTAVNTPGAKY